MLKTLVVFAVILFITADSFGTLYPDVRRQKFEACFYRNESAHLYDQNYDNSRSYFLAIIDTSERSVY